MNTQERKMLEHIAACDGINAPTTAELLKIADRHALNMLQINGHIEALSPRKYKGVRRFRITDAGRNALARVAA